MAKTVRPVPTPDADAPMSPDDIAFVLVAAGSGSRAGQPIPKQYVRLAGKPILAHTIEALAVLGARIQPVIASGDESLFDDLRGRLSERARALLLTPAFGAATRQGSVLAGLRALSGVQPPRYVLIHDGARATPGAALLRRTAQSLLRSPAVLPAIRVADTVRQIGAGGSAVLDRSTLRAVQTPQGFDFDLILAAHERAAVAGLPDFTDDASLAEWAGHVVTLIDGDPANMKVTMPEDFAMAEARLAAAISDVRTGQGYDVHAFGPGDHVWLGGVKIPHTHGLVGHSDADVLIHAITDAILGALADGDIGSHFPPSDDRWKGAASDIFLRHAMERVAARGGVVSHLDGTLICEAPKVGPHRDAIRARLAEICGLPLSRVAVKATTSERLGFTGRREGIAATAVATIRLPFEEPAAETR